MGLRWVVAYISASSCLHPPFVGSYKSPNASSIVDAGEPGPANVQLQTLPFSDASSSDKEGIKLGGRLSIFLLNCMGEQVLSAGEEEAGEELLPDKDELVRRTAKGVADRTVGSMAALSGAHGLTYMEFASGRAKAKPRMTTKSGKMRHLLFRKHAEGRL